MVYELTCSSNSKQHPGKFILDHCCSFPDSLGLEEDMGFESTFLWSYSKLLWIIYKSEDTEPRNYNRVELSYFFIPRWGRKCSLKLLSSGFLKISDWMSELENTTQIVDLQT